MLTVGDLMTTLPLTVQQETTLGEMMQLMQAENCRQLPVIDAGGTLVGIVTDRDIRLVLNSPLVLRERAQDDAMMAQITANDCMTPDPIAIAPETPAYRAAEMLSAYKFGALPVVVDKRLVGIISVTDYLNHFVDGQNPEVLENL